MHLADFLDQEKKSVAQASRETGIPHETLRKYAKKERTPRAENMLRIIDWSGGLVTAADFYSTENAS